MRESRRARTAVVNGNNCCGRCHSKARVPNARCQTVVRVITVITSYRDIHAVCVRRRRRRRSRSLSLSRSHRLPRIAIARFVIDSRLSRAVAVESVATIGKKRIAGGGGQVLENEEDGRKVPKWSTPRWRFSRVPRFFPSSLLETDAYRETDKRCRGLMILPSPVRTDNGRPAREG